MADCDRIVITQKKKEPTFVLGLYKNNFPKEEIKLLTLIESVRMGCVKVKK
jgi:hypothetical protein